MTTFHRLRILAIGAAVIALGSCRASDFDVYDSGSTDADRFAMQTYPVWNRTGPYKERDLFRETDYGHPSTTTPYEQPPEPEAEVETVVYETHTNFVTNSVAPVQTVAHYGKLVDEGHWLPAIPVEDVPSQYLRREVPFKASYPKGTLVVDTQSRHLYFVLGNGRAIRYGVGIGRQGHAWKGEGVIRYKRAWPKWTPSEETIARQPEMKMFSASYGGLVGGTKNPLGARALYIYANGRDTLFRVHGTPDWKSIGKEVSSGCIRMFNQDVIDLAARVKDGARIIVR